MPHRIEKRDKLLMVHFSGETSVSESREPFREIMRTLPAGPAIILVVYEDGCTYLGGPQETLQFHLAADEALGKIESGAIAFLCHEDALSL